MEYASFFSGIEAATVAWAPLNWSPVLFSEIDPYCNALFEYYYPDVNNVGDINTAYEEGKLDHYIRWPDVVAGGAPCQAFSVAGKRLGLEDPRGILALQFLRAVKLLRPRWFIFENVPGLLSSNGGRDFGSIVGALAKLVGHCHQVLVGGGAPFVAAHPLYEFLAKAA